MTDTDDRDHGGDDVDDASQADDAPSRSDDRSQDLSDDDVVVHDSPPEWVVLPSPHVVATVATGAVPDIALDALRSVIVPVLGASGRIVDWELTFTGPITTSSAATYWQWRRSWESRWALGPVANLDELRVRARADRRDDALAVLLGELVGSAEQPTAIPAARGDASVAALAALLDRLARTAERGVAVVDEMRPGGRALRTWVPPTGEFMLAASTTSALWLDPVEGLVLVGAHVPHGRCAGIVGYDALGREVRLTCRSGDVVSVAPLDARPLAWLAPTSLRWSVVDVPLVDVWAGTLGNLASAFEAAARAGVPLRVTADVPIV
jgi:hypothetical protein